MEFILSSLRAISEVTLVVFRQNPGFRRSSLTVDGDCLVQVPLLAKSIAELAVGRGMVGFQTHGLTVAGDRFIQVPVIARAGASPRLTYISAESGFRRTASPVGGNRFLPFPLILEDISQKVVGLGMIGLQTQSLTAASKRLIQISLISQSNPPDFCSCLGKIRLSDAATAGSWRVASSSFPWFFRALPRLQ